MDQNFERILSAALSLDHESQALLADRLAIELSKNSNEVKRSDRGEMTERIDSAEDLRLLHAARAENEGKPSLTHSEMMRELGLEE